MRGKSQHQNKKKEEKTSQHQSSVIGLWGKNILIIKNMKIQSSFPIILWSHVRSTSSSPTLASREFFFLSLLYLLLSLHRSVLHGLSRFERSGRSCSERAASIRARGAFENPPGQRSGAETGDPG